MNLSLSLAQLQVAAGDFHRNKNRALEMIDLSLAAGSELILFPEMWSAGFDYSDCRAYAQANRDLLDELQGIADAKGIAIGGSYLMEEQGKFYNQFILLQPALPRLTYNKIHLFRLMKEDEYLSAGNRVSLYQTRWGLLSLSVCYDLRFPEMFRLARGRGASLVLMAAGWPSKRITHWKTLLRARAIENQIFIAAVNCVAGSDNNPFGGSSEVIDPWGETITEAGSQQEELIHAVVDLDDAARVRETHPFFDDRLPEYSLD